MKSTGNGIVFTTLGIRLGIKFHECKFYWVYRTTGRGPGFGNAWSNFSGVKIKQ